MGTENLGKTQTKPYVISRPWTFGIVASHPNSQLVNHQISAIQAQGLSEYEILIVSPQKPDNEVVRWVPISESPGTNWITRKKTCLHSMLAMKI